MYASSTAWKTVAEVDGKKVEITIAKGAGVDANGNTIDLAVDASGNKYVLGGVTESEYTGYTINAYRDFIAADGSVMRSELLHTDQFKHRDRCYSVTPYVEPEPEVPEEPDPTDPDYDPTQDPDYNPDSGDSDDNGHYTGDPSVEPDFWN